MKFFKTSFLILFLSILIVPCVNAKDILEIPGTGDSQELLRGLAKVFNESQDVITVSIPNSVGSGGGVKLVGTGANELGRVARGIKSKEKRYNLKYIQFASSPVVFAVSHNVKGVDNITAEQVAGIYSGEIKNWRALGVNPGKIYVISREPGDSSRKVLEKNIPGYKDIGKSIGKVIYSTPEAAGILN